MRKKLCLAYIAANELTEDKIRKIDFKKLTHITVAFSSIAKCGDLWLPCISDAVKEAFRLISAEINRTEADTKILVSVGGAEADGFCQASRTEENRKAFSSEIKKIITENHLDGVDIDWEYPGESLLGITKCPNCKKDFIKLLQALRCELGGDKLITAAVGSNRFVGIDVKTMGELLDYVFVMTYDLGPSHSNAHLSKLFTLLWSYCGIPREKTCIGVPFYGRNVSCLEETVAYNDVSHKKSVHIFGQSFCRHNNGSFCYDTPADIVKKGIWAREKGLGGIFCWEINTDVNNRMINAMYNGIN